MPSAFYDKRRNGWIADYRGLFQSGTQRLRARVSLTRILSDSTAKADATAFAEELDRYCRFLERPHADQEVSHALAIGAISDEGPRGSMLTRARFTPTDAPVPPLMMFNLKSPPIDSDLRKLQPKIDLETYSKYTSLG